LGNCALLLVNYELPITQLLPLGDFMTIKVLVPELGESVVEATVQEWLKNVGDYVNVGEALVTLETDKVDVEVGAEKNGVLKEIKVEAGTDVAVGDVLAVIDEEAEAGTSKNGTSAETAEPESSEEAETAEEKEAEKEPVAAQGDGREQVTPVAKRVAEDKGVDVSKVSGTGPGGRVTRQDVQAYSETQQGKAAPELSKAVQEPAKSEGKPTSTPTKERSGREERIKMSRRRRTIASRLVEAQQTAAMLTTFNEIDMTAVMEMRKRRQEEFVKRHDVKLGFMSFFVKASIGALKAFPQVNAEIDGDEIVLKHYYDIGMAIGAEEGLVVPVVRDADKLTFAEIELAIKDYVQKTQEGKLTLEDLRGGTFTITNGGVFGSMLSTPILNPPQVGILGLHKIEERPIALNGEVVIRPMMYVALSYDHRIVDGREAVQFLVRLKELIEEPEVLLLEG
jgi:2-oxoglutarate dehydrogenase E2 component (dihydrolipoamide succinyltransferase)